jgi:hypothetical protein
VWSAVLVCIEMFYSCSTIQLSFRKIDHQLAAGESGRNHGDPSFYVYPF